MLCTIMSSFPRSCHPMSAGYMNKQSAGQQPGRSEFPLCIPPDRKAPPMFLLNRSHSSHVPGPVLVALLAFAPMIPTAATAQTNRTADWQTTYEKSGFKATGRYNETVAYCRRLAG